MTARLARGTVLAGFLVAALGALGVIFGERPHLDFDDLDPWLVVYAVGLLTGLGAIPFLLHARYTSRTDDLDRRWELALIAWGGLAFAGVAAFVVVGLLAGLGAASAVGSLAIVGAVACGLVVAGLAILIVTTG